jgi:hypothetical protein
MRAGEIRIKIMLITTKAIIIAFLNKSVITMNDAEKPGSIQGETSINR